MSSMVMYNAALHAFERSRKEYESTRLAREQSERDKQIFENDLKIKEQEMRNATLKGDMTQRSADLQLMMINDAKSKAKNAYRFQQDQINSAEHKASMRSQASLDVMKQTVESDPQSFSDMFELKNVGGQSYPVAKKEKKGEEVSRKDIVDMARKMAINDVDPLKAEQVPFAERMKKALPLAEELLAGKKQAEPEYQFKVGEVQAFGAKGNYKYQGKGKWRKAQ